MNPRKILTTSTLASLVLLAVSILSVSGEAWHTWGNYYRVEVMFTRLENDAGIIANGKRCDVFTKCDPRLYTSIDIDQPYAGYPGAATSPGDFSLILTQMDRNVLDMSNQIIKNICNRPRPTRVTVRVQAMDYDYMNANDLMENFDCTFNFEPTPRDEMLWSPTTACRAYHQPHRIRLFYKWRIIPIHSGECYSTGLLNLIARSTTTTTTTTTTSTTPTTPTITTTTTTTSTESPTMTTDEVPMTENLTTEEAVERMETAIASGATEETTEETTVQVKVTANDTTRLVVFDLPSTTSADPAEAGDVVYHDYEEGEVFTYSPYLPALN
ncbi:hypothetical protein RvY_17398 [Ramazzottius varieornatus]|uniref:Uncharacterized protein n=1 Tax=Ramazzottius varieornatus TaxID=947166 RepID=A0A1D1W913_RAMVA|nr:hypothetical protein RvY_17398 [Ramazzottius varieornatus]